MTEEQRMVGNPTRSVGQRVKPTLDTKFHVDYSWWDREDRDLRTYLISHLLPAQRDNFSRNHDEATVDWIDPTTAEVRRVDSLQQALAEAAKDPQVFDVRARDLEGRRPIRGGLSLLA